MAPRKHTEANGEQAEGGRSRSNSGSKRGGGGDDEYLRRRERNNIAVRKSRELSRAKAKQTEEKVSKLRDENKNLEQKVKLLTKELGVLKDLFMSTAAPGIGDSSGAQGGLSVKEEQILGELKAVTETDHKYSMG